MKFRLAIVFSLALILVLAGCKGDPRQRSIKHTANAEAALKKNDSKTAQIEIRAALKDDPNNARANFVAGELEKRAGFLSAAYRDYFNAIKFDGSMLDARLAIADLLLETANFQESSEQVKAILEVPKWSNNLRAKLIQAEGMMAQGRVDQGKALVSEVLLTEPQNPRALMDRAFLRASQNDTAGAESDLRLLQQVSPDSLGPVVALSGLFEKEGDKEKSEAILKDFVTKNNTAANNYVLGVALAKHGKTAEAEQSFKAVKTLAGSDRRLRAILPQFYLATGRPQEAEAEYRSLIKEDPTDSLSAQSLARMYLTQARYSDAEAILTDLIKVNPRDASSVLLRGQLEVISGNYDQAMIDIQLARKLNPASSAPSMELAKAMLQSGQIPRAKATLEEVLTKWPENVPAHLILATIEINTGEIDFAERNVNQAVAAGAKGANVDLMLTQIKAARGDMNGAATMTEKLLAGTHTLPERLTIQENLGWMRLKQGRFADAQKIARDMLAEQPNSSAGVLILASAYLVQNKSAAAVTELTSWASKHPSPAVYSEIGNLQLRGATPALAVASFQKALTIDPASNIAKLGLAEAYGANHQLPEAINVYNDLLKTTPSNSRYLLRLGTAYEAQGDWKSAQKTYERALQFDSESAPIRNNLAWLYAEHGGNLDVALQMAQSVVAAESKQPHYSDTLGWIYLKKGANDAALQQFNQCVQMSPKDPEYRYHLGLTLMKLGRKDQAKEQLQAALKVAQFEGRDDAQKLMEELSR
jgi:Tfp pilus assembly protein PilF